jgi:hypothetical protein
MLLSSTAMSWLFFSSNFLFARTRTEQQVAVALTRFRTFSLRQMHLSIPGMHAIILQMPLTCWVKSWNQKFYAQILHQCLVSFLMVWADKVGSVRAPQNKRVETQDYPLAQILHIACMQIIKSFCPDSPIQSESQPIQLRWFHFVWTRSSRH